MAGTQLTKLRWALGINGVLSIVFGVVILIWPGISLFALTILFGAYALDRHHRSRRGDQRDRRPAARLACRLESARHCGRRDGAESGPGSRRWRCCM
jgi:hypothetical protein